MDTKGTCIVTIALVSNNFQKIISIPSKFFLFSSARSHDFDGMLGTLGTGLPVSMYTTKTSIDMWRFNVPQLKEFFTFSVTIDIKLFYLYQRL